MVLIYCLVGMVVGLCFFICILKAYTIGLKHGKELNKGSIPQVNINPVKVYKEHKQAKEEKNVADSFQEGWQNFWSYDGTPQK